MLALEASLKSELPRETGLSAHQVEAGLSREQRAFRGALRRQCEGERRASRERFRKRPWAQTEAFTARAKAGVLPAYGLESRDKGVLATLRSLLLHEVAHFSGSAHARLKFLRERLDEALARLGMPPADLRSLVQHHPDVRARLARLVDEAARFRDGRIAGVLAAAEVAGGGHQERFLRFFTLGEPAAAELDMDLDEFIRAVLGNPQLRRRFERLKGAAEEEAVSLQQVQAEQVEVALEAAADGAALAAVDAAQREMVDEASVAVEAELEMRAEWEVRRAMAELALSAGHEGADAGANAQGQRAGPLSEADLDIEQEKSMLRNASLATHACTLIDGAIESAIAEVAGPPRGFMFANALPPPVKLK